MKTSQQRKLKFLTENISRCKKCSRLRPNGIAIPYWNSSSKYLMLLEAPGKEEVIRNEPVVGDAGQKLFREIKPLGLYRKDFLIINSVQCRPVEEKRNGKPTYDEIDNCKFWIEKYISVFDPYFMIAFGNYAMYTLFGEKTGITHSSGKPRIYKGTNIMPCVHPSALLYGDERLKLFRKSIKEFKKMTNWTVKFKEK